MAGAKHYHVLVGLCGLYIPDTNYVFTNLRDAQRFAREEAESARSGGERVRKVPRAGLGYYTVGDHNCIEITDCYEAECLSAPDGDDR